MKTAMKLAAFLPLVLFTANASATTYYCSPKAELVPARGGGYTTKAVSQDDADTQVGFRFELRNLTVLDIGQAGQIIGKEQVKDGNKSECPVPNKNDVQYTGAANAYTPEVFAFPAETFSGARHIEVSDILDDDADGMACHGYVLSCDLAN
jgi:hypothetical protein